MPLAVSEEKLSESISLWRVYSSKEACAHKGPFVGVFVLIREKQAKTAIAKGLVMQAPHALGMQEVRELAEQLAQKTNADTLMLERHGRWIRVELCRLQVKNEENSDSTGVGSCGGRMGQCADDMRLEHPRA